MSTRTVVVVPCYNEARRLVMDRFLELARSGAVTVLFVDDGSRDATRAILETAVAQEPGLLSLLVLARNSGKAEAVRRGMLAGIAMGADVVGFLDADGATPPMEMLRLRGFLDSWPADAVIGSRVRLLGLDIRRRAARHYAGRVLATYVSQIVLELPVYDTQCGAKLFRRLPALDAALARPFLTSWVFDVELIGRLRFGTGGEPPLPFGDIVEIPLLQWVDIPGSKIRFGSGIRAVIDLSRLALIFRRARRLYGSYTTRPQRFQP
ncbi:MAG: glycosyltransferase [Vicinamibacterales bacterium]|nr:glycosyltransferase [Vicinamibacterales bacterium]